MKLILSHQALGFDTELISEINLESEQPLWKRSYSRTYLYEQQQVMLLVLREVAVRM